MTRTNCAGMAERLVEIAAELGTDELRVLLLVAERLARGRRQYGALQVAHDGRDFRHEALEEVADALVYVSATLIRGRA